MVDIVRDASAVLVRLKHHILFWTFPLVSFCALLLSDSVTVTNLQWHHALGPCNRAAMKGAQHTALVVALQLSWRLAAEAYSQWRPPTYLEEAPLWHPKLKQLAAVTAAVADHQRRAAAVLIGCGRELQGQVPRAGGQVTAPHTTAPQHALASPWWKG